MILRKSRFHDDPILLLHRYAQDKIYFLIRSALLWQKRKPSRRLDPGLRRHCRRPERPEDGQSIKDFTGKRWRIRSPTLCAE